MFLPILILSLLGASSADFFFYEQPSSRGFSDVGAGPSGPSDPTMDFYREDHPQVIVDRFLARFFKAIESKEANTITGLFIQNFLFKGCQALYNRQETVEMLMMIPQGSTFKYELTSIQDIGTFIRCEIYITGLMQKYVPFSFVLNKADVQLESAAYLFCPPPEKKMKRALIESKASGASDFFAREFLKSSKDAVDRRDTVAIANYFDDWFMFKGCKKTYGKGDTLEQILQLRDNGFPFNFNLKRSNFYDLNWNYQQIEFLIDISGPNATHTAEFLYYPRQMLLKAGKAKKCRSRKAASAPPDSKVYVDQFLASLKQTMASHDPNTIGRIFDDNFLFKGCHGTYNKAQAIQTVTKAAAQTPLNFNLKSSNWNAFGQIECTVSISGIQDDLGAKFVYCPQKNVLKSGSVLSCGQRGFASGEDQEPRSFIDFF